MSASSDIATGSDDDDDDDDDDSFFLSRILDADLARSSLTHLRGPCAVTVAARGLKDDIIIYITCLSDDWLATTMKHNKPL